MVMAERSGSDHAPCSCRLTVHMPCHALPCFYHGPCCSIQHLSDHVVKSCLINTRFMMVDEEGISAEPRPCRAEQRSTVQCGRDGRGSKAMGCTHTDNVLFHIHHHSASPRTRQQYQCPYFTNLALTASVIAWYGMDE